MERVHCILLAGALSGLVLAQGCEQKAEAKVQVEKLPDVTPSVPAVPTIPPPPHPIQYQDQSYSIYGLRRNLRRTIDTDVSVTAYIAKVFIPPECPPKEKCPTPAAPHVWLSDVAGEPVEVIFTPHLIPMDRGIFTTIYATQHRSFTDAQLLDLYRAYYANAPFVRVTSQIPATKDSAHTNFIDMTVRVVRGRIVVLVAEDNLVRGASGVAVQNFNRMYGYDEKAGLA